MKRDFNKLEMRSKCERSFKKASNLLSSALQFEPGQADHRSSFRLTPLGWPLNWGVLGYLQAITHRSIRSILTWSSIKQRHTTNWAPGMTERERKSVGAPFIHFSPSYCRLQLNKRWLPASVTGTCLSVVGKYAAVFSFQDWKNDF